MKKIIAKNFYKILMSLIIVCVIITVLTRIERNLKILIILVSSLVFLIFYIIHEECMNEIGTNVFQIENIIRKELGKDLSECDVKKIYDNEYNKYFNKQKD